MTGIRRMTTVAALWVGIAATGAQAATQPCVTEQEAQSLFLAAAPDALTAVGQKCAASLPPTAILRAGLPALTAKYRPASDAAWPMAIAAIAKIAGPEMKGVDPAMIRPMVGPMIGQMAGDKLKPQDCAVIDRLLTLMEPLPPANTAGLIVTIAQAANRDKSGKGALPICPAAPLPAAT